MQPPWIFDPITVAGIVYIGLLKRRCSQECFPGRHHAAIHFVADKSVKENLSGLAYFALPHVLLGLVSTSLLVRL